MDSETRSRWLEAVKSRDASYDERFVYGVKTTRIYCRPSCPSKKPVQENIVLFSSPAEAEAAGYRACKRCTPARDITPKEALAEEIVNYIARNLERAITLESLSDEFKVSKYHLQRTFKAVIGVTPRQYIEAKRLEVFKARVGEGERVDSAMYGSGFKSRSRLYEKVPRIGMTPTEYRRGGDAVKIAYTLQDTAAAKVLVARTEKGVCALYLGEDEATLIQSLKQEYPNAQLARSEEGLRGAVDAIKDYFEGRDFNPRVPLDIHRTAFQWKVMEAIQKIPAGSVKTYSQLAESIGKPRAIRAVASACARNPVSIIVPCHRVLRKNGDLGGYRWGLPLKRRLLDLERA
jgi:AraC family transcriptional regulator of adaptative response/methylated-DNA-[protein]-cysteine methyltransferase